MGSEYSYSNQLLSTSLTEPVVQQAKTSKLRAQKYFHSCNESTKIKGFIVLQF